LQSRPVRIRLRPGWGISSCRLEVNFRYRLTPCADVVANGGRYLLEIPCPTGGLRGIRSDGKRDVAALFRRIGSRIFLCHLVGTKGNQYNHAEAPPLVRKSWTSGSFAHAGEFGPEST
jgi:hypothetical protein